MSPESKDRKKQLESISGAIESKRKELGLDKIQAKKSSVPDSDIQALSDAAKKQRLSKKRGYMVSKPKGESAKETSPAPEAQDLPKFVIDSPEKVKDLLEVLCDSSRRIYTGNVKIMIEMNEIVGYTEEPVKPEKELKDIIITRDKFEEITKYFESPEKSNEEIKQMVKGLSKEKFLKAMELDADTIVKKPILKLDGTVEYKFIAAIFEDDEPKQ